tara:strand:+ start:958 stop:1944 length:987 start_codon:yes stop_codon:yes gene_type:complete
MIQYIIAAGIGAFLGSQSKKSKKAYAKGGYVMDDYTLTLKPDSTIINEVYKGKYDDDTLDMSESFNRTWSIKQEQYDKLKSNKPITIEGGNVSWEWRFTVTRDMVEKVEKRTMTKKEVKFAKGGKVELHKHPQGHWMLINPLSFQVGEDFVNEQDAKDYAWNNGIELTNSSYAEGGKITKLKKYKSIIEKHRAFNKLYEDTGQDYDYALEMWIPKYNELVDVYSEQEKDNLIESLSKLNSTYAHGGEVSKYKTGITKYGKNQYAVRVDIGDKELIPKLLYDRWDSKAEAEAFAKRLAKRNNGTYVGEDGLFAKGGEVLVVKTRKKIKN